MSLEFFDEVETTVANTHFLRAVKDAKQKAPVDLHLIDYDQLSEFEKAYSQKLDIRALLKSKKIPYYQFRKFLLEDGRQSWASLIDDIGSYRFGRFLERKQKAHAIWQKYLVETPKEDKLQESVKGGTVHEFHSTSESLTEVVPDSKAVGSGSKAESLKRLSVDSPDNGKPAESTVGETPAPSLGSAASVVEGMDSKTSKGEKPKEGSVMDLKKPEEITLDEVRKILLSNLSTNSLERMRALMNTDQLITPGSLFDDVSKVVATQLSPRVAVFRKTSHYRRLVQLANYAKRVVGYKDFRIFRPLGRGSFGTVYAVQKIDTGAIYAMKEMK